MKRAFILLVFLAAISFAQEPAITFQSKTELVLVPVVVTRDNRPITGLTVENFIVRHQGRPESISVFEEITAIDGSGPQPSLPPQTTSNFGQGDIHNDTFIVLLDFLNADWENADHMRACIREFAKLFADAKTHASVLLLSTQGIVQAHSFTSDPAVLLKAVDAWTNKRSDPARTILAEAKSSWASAYSGTSMDGTIAAFEKNALFSELEDLDRAEVTAQALVQVCAAFGGIPGRKRLIWVSTGFPSVQDIFDAERASLAFKIHDKMDRAWQALSAHNIVVYPIDSSGGAVNPQFGLPSNTSSLLEVAKITGGRVCVDRLNNCMKRALTSDNHYYLLGFYLHGNPKPGWHKLKVELKGQKAKVRSRVGFLVGDDRPKPKEIDRDIVLTALAAPLDYTSIPLTLHWEDAPPPKDNSRQIQLTILSPPHGVLVDQNSATLDLDFLAFVRPIGQIVGQGYPVSLLRKLTPDQQQILMKNGFGYRTRIPITVGKYELKIFLRDNLTEKIGTVSTSLDLK